MSEFENNFQLARQQYNEGKFRAAYETLEGLLKDRDNIDPSLLVEIEDLYKRLPREASQTCATRRENINTIHTLNDYMAVDQYDLEAELAAWRDAILPTDPNNDTLYKNASKHLSRLKIEYQKFLDAETVRQQVQALWDSARQLRIDNPQVAVNRILEIYTQAERIAREAADGDPSNTYLQVLWDNAKAHRERLSGEEEAMTSGGLMGEYQRVLDHIDRIPENELVPVYNMQGAFMRNMPRDEARQTVLDFARQYATAKANEYIGEAEEYLDNHDPKRAEGALAQRDKIEAFLNPNDRQSLDRLREDILKEKRRLEQAETITQEAANQVQELGALAAWREYLNGEAKYPDGADLSPEVKAAREIILTIANQEIRDISIRLESLFNQDQLSQAEQLAATTLSNYRIMGLPSLVGIENWQTDIQYRQNQKQQLQSELQTIQRLATSGSVEKAVQQLQSVDTQYLSTGILESNSALQTLYDQVKTEVKARSNAREQLDYLSRALEATTEVSVEEAIKNAERAGKIDSAYQNDFHDLRMRLELHLEYLRVRNLAAQHKFEEAVKRLEAIIDHPLITGNYKAEVSNFLDDLKREYAAQSNNDQVLKLAETLLETNPQQVYRDLERFSPRNAAEDRKATDLKNKARIKWLAKVEQALKEIKIANPPDIDLLTEYEDTLQELDDALYKRYSQRILVYNLVRQALNAEASGSLAQATQHLKNAVASAGGSDRLVIADKIRVIERRLKEREIDQLLEAAHNQTEDESTLLERLINMQTDLSRLASETGDSQYALWQLEIMLTQGQYQKDAASSRRMFVNASVLGNRLTAELRAAGQLDETTKLLLKVANYAPKIGEARLDVEKYLKAESDIGRFISTIDNWNKVFDNEYNSVMPHLALWYKDLAAEVSDTLRKQVRGKAVNADNLEAYARLMILDPTGDFADDVINRLPSLQKDLEEETEKLIQSVTTNRDYQAARGVDIIRYQIEIFEKHYRKLNTINQVLNRFKKQLGSDADQLLSSTVLKMEDTSRTVAIIKNLNEIALNFEAYLEGLQNIRHTVSQKEVTAQYDNFMKDVRNLTTSTSSSGLKISDLSKHAAVVYLGQRKDGFFTAQSELEILLAEVTRMIEAEDYSSELQRLREKVSNQFSRQGDMFVERRNSYRIFDPWQNRSIESWDRVSELIVERKGKIDKVLRWAACFGLPEDLLTENMEEDIPENPEFRVVDWEEYEQHAEELLAKADFRQTRELIKEVIEKTNSSTFRSLTDARRLLQIMPPGVDANTVESNRGRRILLETQDYYEALYAKQLEEAKRFQEKISHVEQQLRHLEQSFNDGLQVMRENQGQGMFKRGNRESLTKGEKTAQNAITGIKNICPDYARIPDMQRRFDAIRRKK